MSYTKRLSKKERAEAEAAAMAARTVIVCQNLGQAMVDARRAQLRALASADYVFEAERKRERIRKRNLKNAEKTVHTVEPKKEPK